MSTEDYAVACAMNRYGGGFVRVLGELAMRADADNLEKIKEAWPDYWTTYARVSERNQQPKENPCPTKSKPSPS